MPHPLASSATGRTLRSLSLPIRVLFSAFLLTIGIGYLTALAYLYISDIGPHRKMGDGLVEGIVIKYRGTPTSSRLEVALKSIMADRIDPAGRDELLAWLAAGAPEAGYPKIAPLLEKNCVVCHSPQSGMPVPSLASYQDVKKLTWVDHGISVGQLARVSHVHLFGISIIFLLTGAIFSLGEMRPAFRAAVVAAPYVSIWVDIGSWWLIKWEPLFGYLVVAGGALMGVSLAAQIFFSLWEMWFISRDDGALSP